MRRGHLCQLAWRGWFALLPVLLACFVVPANASAADFDPAAVIPGVTWGDASSPNPVRPREIRPTDLDFRRDLRDGAWSQAYQDELIAAPLSLDAAIRLRFFAPSNSVGNGVNAALFSPAAQQARADKRAQALPILLAELDARFNTLTAALDKADRVVLPPRQVYYCAWITNAQTSLPIPDLASKLAQRCVQDRTAFLSAMAARLADQQPRADLPLTDPLQPPGGATDSQPPADAARALAMLYPADQDANASIAPMEAAFSARLRQRFDAAGDRMERSLDEAVARYAASETITAPDRECFGLLGPYARVWPSDERFDLSKRLVTACRRAVQATLEPRLQRLIAGVHQTIMEQPIATAAVQQSWPACFAMWRPYFNAPSGDTLNPLEFGLSQDQMHELANSCPADLDSRNQVIFQQHLATVVARVRAYPLTRSGLELGHWFELTDADLAWAPKPQNPFDGGQAAFHDKAVKAFSAEFETVAAPLRHAATAAGLQEIDAAFAGDSVSAPRGIALCEPYVSPYDTAQPLAPSFAADSPRSQFVQACANHMQAISAARLQKALAEAELRSLDGLALAVKDDDGNLVPENPETLVKAAATDGVQIVFTSTSIVIRSFNPGRPTLKGALVKAKRPNDVQVMRVDDLAMFPGFNGPLETVSCLATPREDGQLHGLSQGLAGMALLSFSDGAAGAGYRALGESVRAKVSSHECSVAKHWLTGEWPASALTLRAADPVPAAAADR